MNGADASYLQHGAQAQFGTTITDENDPLFLLFARQGLLNEILHHQQAPPPHGWKMDEWHDAMAPLRAHQKKLRLELAQVEAKLKAHMSRELYTKYSMMVNP